MVTGDGAMVNGVLTGVIFKQWSLAHWWMMAWITGSLVDDGLDVWITGSLVDDVRCALLVLCLCQIL